MIGICHGQLFQLIIEVFGIAGVLVKTKTIQFVLRLKNWTEYLCPCAHILCFVLFLFSLLLIRLTEWEDKEEGKEVTQQWEDDWDDDDVSDDFSLQLRRELESNTEKK